MLFGRGSKGGIGGYNFTEECRQALARAREEANLLGHEYVSTEHLVLGLTSLPNGEAYRILAALDVDVPSLRARIIDTCKPQKNASHQGRDLPYTSRAKKVLELAMTEARELRYDYVGAEHLLLGVLREEKGVGAQSLAEFGVTVERARAILLGQTLPASTDFTVVIDDASERSIYEQIVNRIQEGVAVGNLKPGDRLPTVRHLADKLDIAPGTVARAYGELERLGVVVTEGARGTRVAQRERPPMPASERPQTLVGLLRPVAVAGFHLGASAPELRAALEDAMKDIFPESEAA